MSNDKARALANKLRVRDAELDAFLLRLERMLEKATRKLVLSANEAKTLEAIFQLKDLELVLAEAGLEKEMLKLRSLYALELGEVVDNFAAQGVVRGGIFTALDKQIVETLISNDLNRVGKIFNTVAADFKSSITRSILLGEPVIADDILERRPSKVSAQIKAEVNTAMSVFNRTVTVKKAVDLFGDDPTFEYVGPAADGVTKIRPFCENIVGQRFKLSEIKQMDNGQGLDVLTAGGGWNCRHQWRIVGEVDAD